jgi:hypothetical protein
MGKRKTIQMASPERVHTDKGEESSDGVGEMGESRVLKVTTKRKDRCCASMGSKDLEGKEMEEPKKNEKDKPYDKYLQSLTLS